MIPASPTSALFPSRTIRKMSLRKIVIPLALLSGLSVAVWSALAHEGEHHSPGGNGQPGDAPLAAMGFTPCADGMAGTFPCNKVDLAAFLPVADIDGTDAAGVTANDIWGWTDPLTDREYALVGLSNGVAFVEVTDPTAPVYLGNLPGHTVDSLWRGLKVYRDDVYVHETECVVYRGPDAQHMWREICFNSNEDTLTIVDVTDKGAPRQLSRTGYAGSGYTHQGWLTGDQTRFLLDDELDERNFTLAKNR